MARWALRALHGFFFTRCISNASDTRKFETTQKAGWAQHVWRHSGAMRSIEPGIHNPCADQSAATAMILDHMKQRARWALLARAPALRAITHSGHMGSGPAPRGASRNDGSRGERAQRTLIRSGNPRCHSRLIAEPVIGRHLRRACAGPSRCPGTTAANGAAHQHTQPLRNDDS